MRKTVVTVLLAVSLCVLLFGALASAAPAEQTVVGVAKPALLTVFSNKIITQTQSAAVNIQPYDEGEVFYTVDQNGVNTFTAVLEFSNDGTNWAAATGDSLIDANTADVTTYTLASLLGKYARVRVSSIATSTLPLTLSVSINAK